MSLIPSMRSPHPFLFFFFNDTATTEIYTLSLHDALPIYSVYGWILKPPGFDAAKRYPLVYLLHGGPQTAWLDLWHARWNYQMFAARGYVVAVVNRHGSTGYGQKFTDAVSQHWGDYPYEDLMKGLDVVARLPYVDSTRMGAAGASYGGYMVYWIAGHTNRFKALVAHDGVFNPVSMAGSTEGLWFVNWEFGGTPYAHPGLYEKWSPLNFVQNWKTPLLIVHSQLDYRVRSEEHTSELHSPLHLVCPLLLEKKKNQTVT